MQNIWDERYSIEEYYYGINPNEFLKASLKDLKPAKILLPAEGEGRNAVYCAKLGWDVQCYDMSMVGREKAMKLAAINNVMIDYQIESHESFISNYKYDAVGIFYNHLAEYDRKIFHNKMVDLISKDGYLILEAFSKKQLEKPTGGPTNLDLLYSLSDLLNDFKNLEIISAIETDENLNEGDGHKGISSIIRIFAKKN